MSKLSGSLIPNQSSVIISNLASTPTFTGPFAAGQALAVQVYQIDKRVTVEVAGVSAGAAVASVATSAAVVAAAQRPQATITIPVTVINNSLRLAAAGKAEITTAGTINVYLDLLGTAAWLITGNAGWDRFQLSYLLA